MRVENRGEAALFAVHGAGTGYLSEYTGIVDVCRVPYDVLICILVLEQKRAHVRLAPLHHLQDGGSDLGVLDGNGLIETGEQRSLRNGDSHDLGVDVGNSGLLERLFGSRFAAPPTSISRRIVTGPGGCASSPSCAACLPIRPLRLATVISRRRPVGRGTLGLAHIRLGFF